MAEPLLVVGLGNPGANYARTRHNLGFVVADLLAARLGAKFKAHKRSGAEVATGRSAGRSLVLAKPRCYMNESGRQIGPLAKFYSVAPANIIVIHDDLDSSSAASGSRSAAAKAATTGCARWWPRWVPKTFSGCVSGSAARPAARTRRRLCWRTLPRPSAPRSPRSASRPPMPPSCLSNRAWSPHKTASTPGNDPREQTQNPRNRRVEGILRLLGGLR